MTFDGNVVFCIDTLFQALSDVKDAEFEENTNLSVIHKRDLEILQKVSDCVLKRMHYHAFLYFHGLEPVIRDSMPKLGMFLSNYQWKSTHIRTHSRNMSQVSNSSIRLHTSQMFEISHSASPQTQSMHVNESMQIHDDE